METLVLDRDAVERNARMGDVIPAVEAAFAAYQRDDVEMPAKSYVELPEYNGDFRSMPAYMHAQGNGTREEWDAAAVKWVNVHPDNPGDYDLPTVMGTVIYSDPETGFPLSIMDGTELTRQRTGAAAAVATDHLAVVDATSLGSVPAFSPTHNSKRSRRFARSNGSSSATSTTRPSSGSSTSSATNSTSGRDRSLRPPPATFFRQ